MTKWGISRWLLIVGLLFSIPSSLIFDVFATDGMTILEETELQNSQMETIQPSVTEHYNVSLHESMLVITEKNQKDATSLPQQSIKNQKQISLEENLSIQLDSFDDSVINSIKNNLEKNAIMERIFEKSNPFRSSNHLAKADLTSAKLVNVDNQFAKLELDNFQSTPNNDLLITQELETAFATYPVVQFLTISQTIDSVSNVISNYGKSIVSVDNPVSLVFILPIAGYIIFKSENQRLKFYNFRRVSCFIFIRNLLSSGRSRWLLIVCLLLGTPGFLIFEDAFAEDFEIFIGADDDEEHETVGLNDFLNLVNQDGDAFFGFSFSELLDLDFEVPADTNIDYTISVTESLSLAAAATESIAITITVSEELELNSTSPHLGNEELGLVANIDKFDFGVNPTESLGLVANVAAMPTKTLTESLSLAVAESLVLPTIEREETFGLAATGVARIDSIAPTESFGLAATGVARIDSIAPTESLGLVANAAAMPTKTLIESLALTQTNLVAQQEANVEEDLDLAANVATVQTVGSNEFVDLEANVEAMLTKTLTESLSLDANGAIGRSELPQEDLDLDAQASTVYATSRTLTETLDLAAGVSSNLQAADVTVTTVILGATGSVSSVAETATSSPTTDTGGTITFIGGTVQDYTIDAGACTAGCTISFSFTSADLSTAGISSASDVAIFEDASENGVFVELPTTLTVNTSPFTVTATTTASGTDFGIGESTPAAAGGGGSGGDDTDPSIAVGFAPDEYPIILDGVKYKPSQLDKAHTTIAETGKEVEFTIMVYENYGPSNVRYAAMYVNQLGSIIQSDLTATSIIYDGPEKLEIKDPFDLILTANVVKSQIGNKAAFTFNIVFENEIPQSDIVFRIWDLSRNALRVHVPDSLMVVTSEGIVSQQPEPGVVIPEEPEVTPEEEIGVVTPEAPVAIPEKPIITEVVPDEILIKKGWKNIQLDVLKKWGGYDVETVSDIDVLAEFGVKGERIPPYFKQTVKWALKGQTSPEEFVNALKFFKSRGLLSDEIHKQSFEFDNLDGLKTQTQYQDDVDGQIQIEFEDNELYTRADLDSLEAKTTIVRAIANNEEIINQLIDSNRQFNTIPNLKALLDEREADWIRNTKLVTPFMEEMMNNQGALISKALIEHDADDILPLQSISITNAFGVNVIMTEKTHDYKQNDEKWWGKARDTGVYIMSGTSSEEFRGGFTTEIAIAINDSEGNFIGVIKAVIDVQKLFLSQ